MICYDTTCTAVCAFFQNSTPTYCALPGRSARQPQHGIRHVSPAVRLLQIASVVLHSQSISILGVVRNSQINMKQAQTENTSRKKTTKLKRAWCGPKTLADGPLFLSPSLALALGISSFFRRCSDSQSMVQTLPSVPTTPPPRCSSIQMRVPSRSQSREPLPGTCRPSNTISHFLFSCNTK